MNINPFKRKAKVAPAPATPTGARQVTPAQSPAEPSRWNELTVGQLPVGKAVDKVLKLYETYKHTTFKGRQGKVDSDNLHDWLLVNANLPCPQAEWMKAAILCIY